MQHVLQQKLSSVHNIQQTTNILHKFYITISATEGQTYRNIKEV